MMLAMYQRTKSCDFVKQHFCKNTIVNIMTSFAKDEQNTIINQEDQGKIFHLFIDSFGASMAEHARFNENEKGNKKFQNSCTVSDEAFGIFTIERCWATWMTEVTENIKVPPRSAEFTNKNSNSKCGGWTNEGLQHFTNIAKKVLQSRNTDMRKSEEEKYRFTQAQKKMNETNNLPNQEVHFDKHNENTFESFVPYNDFPDHTHQDNIKSNEGNVFVCNVHITCIMIITQLTLLSTNSKPQHHIPKIKSIRTLPMISCWPLMMRVTKAMMTQK